MSTDQQIQGVAESDNQTLDANNGMMTQIEQPTAESTDDAAMEKEDVAKQTKPASSEPKS